MGGALDHLKGDKFLVTEKKAKQCDDEVFCVTEEVLLQVPAQPYGGKVAPAKLSHDVISIVEEIANFHRMVAT